MGSATEAATRATADATPSRSEILAAGARDKLAYYSRVVEPPARIVSFLAALVVLTGCGPQRELLAGANVVVVLADTLRADQLGAYGSAKPLSPFLDELARESLLFENAWAASAQTAASVLSLWSGVYPHRHGVQYYWRTRGFHPRRIRGEPHAPDDLPLLAELFAAQGYRTGAVVTNPWLDPRFGFARGFERYEHLPSRRVKEAHASGTQVNELARELLESWQGQRFLLYLHYMDVHSPYAPPAPYRERFVAGRPGRNVYKNGPRPELRPEDVAYTRALYEAEVRAFDDRVRELFEVLGELGLSGSTLVVFVSDHGEAFYEHGGMGHGWSLYEELVHTPLFFWHTLLRDHARRVEAPVSGVDLLPTLLELVGVEAPAGLQGRSFARLVLGGGSGSFRERVILSELGNAKAARRGSRKLVQTLLPELRLEAFDLASDPTEQSPVDAPGWQAELAGSLAEIPPDPRLEEDVDLAPPETKADKLLYLQLQALGYLD